MKHNCRLQPTVFSSTCIALFSPWYNDSIFHQACVSSKYENHLGYSNWKQHTILATLVLRPTLHNNSIQETRLRIKSVECGRDQGWQFIHIIKMSTVPFSCSKFTSSFPGAAHGSLQTSARMFVFITSMIQSSMLGCELSLYNRPPWRKTCGNSYGCFLLVQSCGEEIII